MENMEQEQVQPYRSYSSKKKHLIGILLILVAVLGYVFYSSPLSDYVSGIEANVTSKSAEIEQLRQQVTDLTAAEEELEVTTEVQRRQSLMSIPVNMEQDEVIRDLIGIAEAYDVELNSISFGEGSSDAEGVSSLRINASFAGNYSDLISFLEGIEENDRFLKVDSISAQVSRINVFDIERVTFSLSIEAFFQQ